MKIFAHRGVSALYPENSQTAISACDASVMHGVEIDLFQTEQSFFVVHDPWLSRLFGVNKKITDTPASEIKSLICQDNKPIPDLKWLIEQVSETNLHLNIELKTIADATLFVEQLQALITQYHFDEKQLLISSFNHQYLADIYRLKPNWPLGMLIAHHPLNVAPLLGQFPIYSLHLSMHAISTELIAQAKQHGLQVFVYTVDQQEDINWLMANKVDGIFANHPEQAYKIVNNLI